MSARLGLALYTVRDACARDFEGTLRAVAEMGYEGVELVRPLRARRSCAAGAARRPRARRLRPSCGARGDRDEPRRAGRRARRARERPARALRGSRRRPRRARPTGSSTGSARPPSARRRRGSASASTTTTASFARSTDGRTVLDRLLQLDDGAPLPASSTSAGPGSPGVEPVGLVERVAPRAPLVHVKDLGGRDRPALRRGRRRRRRTTRASSPRSATSASSGCSSSRTRPKAPRSTRPRRSFAAVTDDGREPGMRSPAQVGIVGCGVISRDVRRQRVGLRRVRHRRLRGPRAFAERGVAAELRARARPRRRAPPIGRDRRRPQPHPAGGARLGDAGGARGGQARVLREAARRRPWRRRGSWPYSPRQHGLRLGCAPDIFLGGAYQAARSLLDEGAIGEPLAVSAAMLSGGQETWHPDPDIFFRGRRRPAARHGAVLRDGDRVAARARPARRRVRLDLRRSSARSRSGRAAGERFVAETPTHITSMLELSSGATAMLVATFEAPGHYASTMLVHGSEGELALPDPNTFDGADADPPGPGRVGGRLLRDPRQPRTHGASASRTWSRRSPRGVRTAPRRALATHVVDVARSILDSCDTGSAVVIGATTARPEAAPVVLARPAGERARG